MVYRFQFCCCTHCSFACSPNLNSFLCPFWHFSFVIILHFILWSQSFRGVLISISFLKYRLIFSGVITFYHIIFCLLFYFTKFHFKWERESVCYNLLFKLLLSPCSYAINSIRLLLPINFIFFQTETTFTLFVSFKKNNIKFFPKCIHIISFLFTTRLYLFDFLCFIFFLLTFSWKLWTTVSLFYFS